MNDKKLDGRESQGLINGAKGPIDQQFGDRESVQTGGGDAAGRDVDKRQNTFIFNLLGADPAGSISQQSMQELASALAQVTDRQSVSRAYQEALPPDAGVSRSRATTFEDILAQLEDFRKLLPFLERLAEDPSAPEVVRRQRDELRQREGNAGQQPHPKGPTYDSPSILRAYLQIEVRPNLSSDDLRVNASLIPDDSVSANDPARHKPLDLDNTQKGKSCQIGEVPQVVNQFLNQALQYLAGQRYELSIEIFLPLDHLCAEVDAWELTDLFFEDDTYLLGTKYPVMVRSQERLERRYLASRLNQWRTSWDEVKKRLPSVPNENDFEHLSQMEACNWKLLAKRLQQKLGLKLTCGLVETHQKDLFTCLLKAASPIAIWPRLDVPEIDQVDEIEQLVTSGPLSGLLTTVLKKRDEADCADCPDSHIGSHLAVLWEDPNRLTPDALTQLRTPGQ